AASSAADKPTRRLGKSLAWNMPRSGSTICSSTAGDNLDAQPAQEANSVSRIRSLAIRRKVYCPSMIWQFRLPLPMEAPIIASMKYSPLSRVESLIRRVVEEPFTWLGSGSIDPFQLASHLIRYYDAPSADGQKPNRFTVFISPQDYDEIGSGRALLERQV